MEINHDVRREEIAKLVKEMMMGEKGMEMKQKSLEGAWIFLLVCV